MAKELKKGLGKGLSELFGDDLLDDEKDGELLNVPIARSSRDQTSRAHALMMRHCRSLPIQSASMVLFSP